MSLWGAKRVRGKTVTSGGGGASAFSAMSSSDPDVVALWNFDEASGTTFTDEVSGHTITLTKGTHYNDGFYEVNNNQVSDGGRLTNIAPGFTCPSSGEYWSNTTLSNDLDPGTSSFTIEAYLSATSIGATTYLAATYNSTTTTGFYIRTKNTGLIETAIYATDGTLVTCNTLTGVRLNDNEVHHLRLVYDAGNTITLYLDNVAVRSVSAASLSGKTINFDELWINNAWVGTLGGNATWYQFRISHNATNNGYGLG